MKYVNAIFLLSALFFTQSHANTAPCNGFKIYFKNKSSKSLTIHRAQVLGASLSTTDPLIIEPNTSVFFTVNQSMEGGNMPGEFLLETRTTPSEDLRVNFDLTNRSMICELGNFSKTGTLNASSQRVVGGVIFTIK